MESVTTYFLTIINNQLFSEDGIFDKILPYEARAEFCQIFRSFFGQWSLKKPLLRLTDLYFEFY